MSSSKFNLQIIAVLAIAIGAVACKSGPATIQPGTPAFSWATAKQAYSSGDYLRATDNLAKLTTTDNEFRGRAQAALMVISSGLAEGYLEVATAYDAGGKMNPNNRTAFRKRASIAQSHARSTLMQYVEAVHAFTGGEKAEMVDFDFGYPNGTLGELPELLKVMKGVLPQESEADSVQTAALRKGVLSSVCRSVGAGNDAAKTIEIFKKQPLQIPRTTLLLAMAHSLHNQASLFGPKKLDEPLRMKMLCNEAVEALEQVPASKERKDLEAQIQKTLKLIKAT